MLARGFKRVCLRYIFEIQTGLLDALEVPPGRRSARLVQEMLPSYVTEMDLPGFGLLDRAPLPVNRGDSFADGLMSPGPPRWRQD